MGRQGLTHGGRRLVSLIIGVLAQGHAQRADAQGQFQGLVEISAADLFIVWNDLDAGEPGLGQDAANPVGIGEGEGARRMGIGGWRDRRQERRSGLHGHGHHRVLARRPPADEGQTAAGFQGRTDIGEGGGRVGEEHHSEPGEGGVESGCPEIRRLGVGLQEVDAAQPLRLGALLGDVQHRLGNIDGVERALRPHRPGES